MNKKIASGVCLLLLLSCGDNSNEIQKIPSKNDGGIAITLRNKLAQKEPDLKILVCATDDSDPKRDLKGKRLCFDGGTVVKYDQQAIIHLDAHKTKQLFDKDPKHRISFLFNDSSARAHVYWSCWEHSKNNINSDTGKTQYFEVTVTQSNLASYSCTVKIP